MREIVSIQVGKCGNQLGSLFWENICWEHGVSPLGKYQGHTEQELEGIDAYFTSGSKGTYAPRAVLVDLQPGPLDAARAGRYGGLFSPDHIIGDSCGAGRLWAKGHYNEGAERVDEVLDVLRKEAETSESLQGFQLCHSLGGGTGSGLGTLIMMKVKEEYPGRIFSTFSVFPSFKVSAPLTEPYNAGFSIHHLTENADVTYCIDNEALYDILYRLDGPKLITDRELNDPVSVCMSDITASLRFPCQLNTDLRKLAINMVPYPRLHFLVPSFAPLKQKSHDYFAFTTEELTQQIFDVNNMMTCCDPKSGRYLTATAIYRGRFSLKDIDDVIYDVTNKEGNNFVEWIPHNVITSTCGIPPRWHKKTATLIGNTTSIQELFNRMLSAFSFMLRKKAFLFRYQSEGVDDAEFTEAETNMADLISEYQQYQDATVEEFTNEDIEEAELGDDWVVVDDVGGDTGASDQ